MTRDMTLEVVLSDPPDVVWRALTEPEALAAWLMPVEGFAPKVGCRFRLKAKPMPGWDGVVNCEVLDVDESRLLSYTWQGTQMKNSTTVVWTLDAADGGTRLRLEHRGFTGIGGTVLNLMHRGGWRKFLTRQLPQYLGSRSEHTEKPE